MGRASRRYPALVLITICSIFAPPANSQEIALLRCRWGYGPSVLQVGVLLPAQNRARLADNTYTEGLLEMMRKTAIERCATTPLPKDQASMPPPTKISITVGTSRDFGWYAGNTQNIYVMARFDLVSQKWESIDNVAAREIAREKRENEMREAEARKKAEEAEALTKRKQVAINDCGARPVLSGGPWFSSTYSVAAMDETQRGNFFCVKTVEYVSAAPNPFGGNAARARFTGYRKDDFQPVTEVRDFAY